MLQPSHRLDFALEALGAEGVRQLRMQHFERHRAIVPEVLGQKHGRHPTTAEFSV